MMVIGVGERLVHFHFSMNYGRIVVDEGPEGRL